MLIKTVESSKIKSQTVPRVFKTAWFAKAARKAKIGDEILCQAIAQIISGQVINLGGGVYKKRLHSNMYRGIILAKTSRYWIFAFLYAKNDRGNINSDELAAFKFLASDYANATDADMKRLLIAKDLLEICHDCQC